MKADIAVFDPAAVRERRRSRSRTSMPKASRSSSSTARWCSRTAHDRGAARAASSTARRTLPADTCPLSRTVVAYPLTACFFKCWYIRSVCGEGFTPREIDSIRFNR